MSCAAASPDDHARRDEGFRAFVARGAERGALWVVEWCCESDSSDMHRMIKILTIIFFAALMVVLNVEFGPQKQLTASQCSVDITRPPGYNTNLPW